MFTHQVNKVMKRYLFLCAAALCLAGCGNTKEKEKSDSSNMLMTYASVEDSASATAPTETAALDTARIAQESEQEKLDNENKIRSFLTDFYNNYLLGNKDPERLKSHFSKKMLSRLKKVYDYEWGDVSEYKGYAFYDLRGDSQDAGGRMLDMTPLGDDWYQVKFVESGVKWKINLQAKVENGKVIITDYKRAKPN